MAVAATVAVMVAAARVEDWGEAARAAGLVAGLVVEVTGAGLVAAMGAEGWEAR